MSLRGDILKLVGFATNKGYVTNVVNAAGVSPSQVENSKRPVPEIMGLVSFYISMQLISSFSSDYYHFVDN